MHRASSGTSEFISQQLKIMQQMQAEQEHRSKQLEERKLKRPGGGLSTKRASAIPEVPPLPSS